DGTLDPRDLTERFIEAISSHTDSAMIYARTTPERARIEADAAHARQKAASRAGPLDGVPISWKDNFDSAGVATEGGSRLLAGRVPEADCPALMHATQAGLVCLGKTHLSELAFSGLGLNPMMATPPNTFDRRRVPGGSSSGAAVSTTAGLAAAGIGSDTGGSVRIPAAWNGLDGLKTTIGAISCEGVIPLSVSFDTPGPLTRTVEDAHLLCNAMTGRQSALPDPSLPERMTLPETLVMDMLDDEVAQAFDHALGLLEAAGVAINRAPVPEFRESADVLASHGGVIVSEAWRQWHSTIEAQPDTMFHQIESRFRGGGAYSADDEAHARAVQARLHQSISARIAEGGMLVMPSSPILPPLNARLLGDEAYYVEKNLLGLRNTRQANLLGLSSITLPTATPMVGVMLFAGANEEDRLVAAGRALEPVLRG
ncbi:MAG: amidase family protein, partial [Pseudomonadota bacterium]